MAKIKEILFPKEVKPVRIAGIRLFNIGGRTKWLVRNAKKLSELLK